MGTIEMRCPTPCDNCGELEELDRMTFNTGYCGCPADCTHGVCRECLAELDEEYDDNE